MSRDSLPDLDPGARTGERFRVLGVLGRGATSTVYRAHDEIGGGDVALKVLRSSLAAGTIAARRFEREARLVGRLDHPAIVKLLATGFLSSRQPWLALELLEGETLEALLAREGRLPLARAIELLDDVLDALAAAHAENVLHRDLKPANLIVRGRAKLLDFGVGRDLADEGPRITAPPQVVGTIAYLAPEQLVPQDGGEIDARVDLWAAGVLFYRMICGTAPFGERSTRVVARIMESEPAPPSSVVGASARVDAFVARALAKDRERRWRSAPAMREALLELA